MHVRTHTSVMIIINTNTQAHINIGANVRTHAYTRAHKNTRTRTFSTHQRDARGSNTSRFVAPGVITGLTSIAGPNMSWVSRSNVSAHLNRKVR